MEIEGIESLGVFYDDANFPRGFGKSGEFTIAEAEILHKYGKTFSALAYGKKEPATEQEKSFVECCKNNKQASTVAEQTWFKYQSIINRQVSVSAFGSAPIVGSQTVVDDMDEDIVDDVMGDEP